MEKRYQENGELLYGFVIDHNKSLYGEPVVIHSWYDSGLLHRENKPARISVTMMSDGKKKIEKRWYKYGLLHREDEPAIISTAMKCWYVNGNMQKIEYPDGHIEYYKDNVLHREAGPAIIKKDGSTEWYKNDVLHREDGPAVELCNGTKAWYENGSLKEHIGLDYTYCHVNERFDLDASYEVFKKDLNELIVKYDSLFETSIYSSFLRQVFDLFTNFIYNKDEHITRMSKIVLMNHERIFSKDCDQSMEH